MAQRWLVIVYLFGLVTFTESARADETAVRKSLAAYVEAFNKHDAQAMGKFWTENGVHRDEVTGEEISGREAITADLTSVFKDNPKIRLSTHLTKLRMIRPEVARGEGEATLSGGGEDPSVTRFTVILVIHDGKWLIDSVDERAVTTAATADEALAQLDWLIGTWAEESEAGRLETAFRRSPSRAYLVRTFALTTGEDEVTQGSQVIAWDPARQQIRSWTFHIDGSFGEAVWSSSEGDWLIRTTQTLVDGRIASGTYVLKRVGTDQLSFQLIGHEIDGEPQPASAPVTLTRVPSETEKTPAAPVNPPSAPAK